MPSVRPGGRTLHFFKDFFNNYLHKIVTQRPVVLLYDGHTSHYPSTVIAASMVENVSLFVLPPNTSHFLQPLDRTIFSPFKRALRKSFIQFHHDNPTRVLTKEELPGMISQAFVESMTKRTIISGFLATGICPFDPQEGLRKQDVPAVTPRKPASHIPSENDNRNNRTVSLLLDGKVNAIEELMKEASEKTKKRETFIPPSGALISTEAYLLKKRNQEADAARRNDSKKAGYIPPFTSKSLGGKINILLLFIIPFLSPC